MVNYTRNIGKLYVIKTSKWFNLVMPIVVLFYQDNGLSMQDIFILKSVYSLAIVALEIPSGWMADVWGRRKTLILGSILGSAGFMMYSFSYGFWAFIVAEIILGAGHSFVSGADSAMLYESLKADKQTDKYVKHEGRISSAGNFAEAIAGIAAGFLAAISLRTPVYGQFFVAFMAVPAAFLLSEPPVATSVHLHSVKGMAREIKNVILRQKELRIAILLSAVTGSATLTFAWLVQPFFKEVGMPVEFFGVAWTALNLSAGVSSAFAFKLAGRFSRLHETLFITVMLSLGYFFSGFAIVREGIFFLFLFYIVRGFASPVFKHYLNIYTPSNMRATVLSARDLIIRSFFAITSPILGWMIDHISLNMAFIFAGSVYLISVTIIILPWLRKDKSASV
jgi:MFS family permease